MIPKSQAFLWLLFMSLLVQACCSDNCSSCQEACKTEMVFTFDAGPGGYSEEDLDTLYNVYKKEGIRTLDTLVHILRPDGRYTNSNIACAQPGELHLHKNVYDSNAIAFRVEYYKIYTGADSVVIDQMDLNVIKSGDACCSCISDVENTFRVDSTVEVVQTLNNKPPFLIRKK